MEGERECVCKMVGHLSSIEDTRDRDVLRNGDKNLLLGTLHTNTTSYLSPSDPLSVSFVACKCQSSSAKYTAGGIVSSRCEIACDARNHRQLFRAIDPPPPGIDFLVRHRFTILKNCESESRHFAETRDFLR